MAISLVFSQTFEYLEIHFLSFRLFICLELETSFKELIKVKTDILLRLVSLQKKELVDSSYPDTSLKVCPQVNPMNSNSGKYLRISKSNNHPTNKTLHICGA